MATPQPPPLTPHQLATIDEDRGPTVVWVTSLLIALSTAAVVLRFAARVSRRMKFGVEDWLSVAALVFVVLYCVTCIISVPYGMGRHIWAADPTKAWRIIQIGLFNALVYVIVHWFIKMSILAFYRRIFTFRVPWFRYSVYALAIYTTGWCIGCFFGSLFQCSPPSLFWNQYNPNLIPPAKGSCGVRNADLVISSSALNTVGDILIFGLPIPMLWQLQLKQGQKFALILVFGTGAFAVAAGIVRLTRSLSAVELDADTTWITADIYLWTAVEASVGLICACLPIVGPVFSVVKRKMASYISDRSSRRTVHGSSSRSTNWTPGSTGLQRNKAKCGASESTANIELGYENVGPNIVRTDEYSVESYPRTEHSLDNYLPPRKGTFPVSPL